jgi:hypothetical protein
MVCRFKNGKVSSPVTSKAGARCHSKINVRVRLWESRSTPTLDATQHYSTLLGATHYYSTLLDATSRYSMMYMYIPSLESSNPSLDTVNITFFKLLNVTKGPGNCE